MKIGDRALVVCTAGVSSRTMEWYGIDEGDVHRIGVFGQVVELGGGDYPGAVMACIQTGRQRVWYSDKALVIVTKHGRKLRKILRRQHAQQR